MGQWGLRQQDLKRFPSEVGAAFPRRDEHLEDPSTLKIRNLMRPTGFLDRAIA